MSRRARWIWQLGLVPLTLVFVVLVAATPALVSVEAWIHARRTVLAWVGGTLLGVGLLVVFAAGLYGLLRTGRRTSDSETHHYLERASSISAFGYRSVWRRFRLNIRGRVAGGTWSDEFTPAELREALGRRAWRAEVRWRRNLFFLGGAALTVAGAAVLALALAPLAVALVADALILSLPVRVAWAMRRNRDPS